MCTEQDLMLTCIAGHQFVPPISMSRLRGAAEVLYTAGELREFRLPSSLCPLCRFPRENQHLLIVTDPTPVPQIHGDELALVQRIGKF